MPDTITPSDRRLIAEAIAAGRITRCPPGFAAIAGFDLGTRREATNAAWRARRGAKSLSGDALQRLREAKRLDVATRTMREIADVRRHTGMSFEGDR